MLRINDIAPDFDAVSTEGPINLHQYLSDSWGMLFSHPKILLLFVQLSLVTWQKSRKNSNQEIVN